MTEDLTWINQMDEAKFKELNSLLLEAVSTHKLNIRELHQIVVNAWCFLSNRPNEFTEISVKRGAALLDFLLASIISLHVKRKWLIKLPANDSHRERSSASLCIDVNLQIKANAPPDGVSLDPSEIEFFIKTDDPMIELAQYSDEFTVVVDLAHCWFHLYTLTTRNRQDKQLRDKESSRSKGYAHYIKTSLKAESTDVIKSFLTSGYCLNCGDKRKTTEVNSSKIYCSPDCQKQFDLFFTDWLRDKWLGDPLFVAFNRMAKIFRDKYGNKQFKQKRKDEVYCPDWPKRQAKNSASNKN